MSNSTYDILLKKTWESRGSVTFPLIAIDHNTSPAVLRLGYYPCFGVTFTPHELPPVEPNEKWVYWWDKADNNNKVKYFKRKPASIRRLKFTAANPPAEDLEEIRKAINGKVGGFAPQALMNEDFIERFNSLVFWERADNLLVSDKLLLSGLHILGRDGAPFSTDTAAHVAVFHMTHHINAAKNNEVTMLTQAVWDDGGYISMYGCC